MTRSVCCLVCSIPLFASSATAGAEDAPLFPDLSPIFIDARDAVSWDAARSINAYGDTALEQIRGNLRIARPAMPAYEPGTA